MDAQATSSDKNDELELDKLISDIESGKIESWSKFVMYATLNGIDTSKNILVSLFNRGKNRCVYDFLENTLTKTSSADKYITNEFLMTLICCEHDFRSRRDGHDFVMCMNPVVLSMQIMNRIPLVILKFLLSFEKPKQQENLDIFSDVGLSRLVNVMYCTRENCLKAFCRSKNEKLLRIITRLEALIEKLDRTTILMK